MDQQTIQEFIEELEGSPKNIRFTRLLTICETVFGDGRASGSHHIFKTPWAGDPRINLQKVRGGKAKTYQVSQVVAALRRMWLQLEEEESEETED